MRTDREIGNTQPASGAPVWPPQPSSRVAPEEQPVDDTPSRFFVGILYGLFVLLASGIVWAVLMVLLWLCTQFSAPLSQLLLHDLPATWYGKAVYPTSFLLCNLPALMKFIRTRSYQPFFAWGVLLGSCSAILTWLAVSWYVTRPHLGT